MKSTFWSYVKSPLSQYVEVDGLVVVEVAGVPVLIGRVVVLGEGDEVVEVDGAVEVGVAAQGELDQEAAAGRGEVVADGVARGGGGVVDAVVGVADPGRVTAAPSAGAIRLCMRITLCSFDVRKKE